MASTKKADKYAAQGRSFSKMCVNERCLRNVMQRVTQLQCRFCDPNKGSVDAYAYIIYICTQYMYNIALYTYINVCSSVGIATGYGLNGRGIESWWGEIFCHPDRPWGPPSLPYNGYRVFPGGRKRPGRDADPSSPSSAEV